MLVVGVICKFDLQDTEKHITQRAKIFKEKIRLSADRAELQMAYDLIMDLTVLENRI